MTEQRAIRQLTRQFFTARQIARAAGVDAKTVRNRARREDWPMKQQGNRFTYRAPKKWLRSRCNIAAVTPMLAILDKAETLRALRRAAVVLGFALELKRNSKCGIESALARTVSNFRHLMPFSVRALRVWIAGVARTGLGALHEKKFGRVGRRARDLNRILK